jgi:hypothetical protein
MSRYHIVFTDRVGGKLAEYETDIEPPVVGDLVRLDHMTGHTDNNVYMVYDRSYMPLDANRVEVTFTLDLYEKDIFQKMLNIFTPREQQFIVVFVLTVLIIIHRYQTLSSHAT